ncbi:MAG: isochorismatase family protein [Bryobacterales bacterium]
MRTLEWPTAETAIIVCDMWNDHWCKSAARRVTEMAPRMNQTLEAARALGVRIVHAPSDTIDHYAGWPQRERILASPQVAPPVEIQRWCYLEPEKEKALPIDDSDGGCDDENPVESRPWTQEHPAIEIADGDVISDQGTEIYNYFVEQGVKHVALMGVHANMCVLGRSFGVRQLTKLGFDVAVVRDLTDAMYDPRDEPYVSHEEGTRLVIEHIEKHWAPSILAADLTKAA